MPCHPRRSDQGQRPCDRRPPPTLAVMPPRTLYVSDLDGTLLSSQGVLPKEHSDRLQRLVSERGVLLTYATARSHLMAARAVGGGWGTPAVVYNGAFTVDARDGSVLRQHFIEESVAAEVVGTARGAGLMPLV